MPQITATLVQLEAQLEALIIAAYDRNEVTGALFKVMFNTGLRACEVLEPQRWQTSDAEYYEVQLSKGEGKRLIEIKEVPAILYEYYSTGKPFLLETYSAINNLFKRTGPVVYFNGNNKRTTLHAFRYRKFKRLAAEGMTLAEIANEMGHVSKGNTAAYVNDEIKMYI